MSSVLSSVTPIAWSFRILKSCRLVKVLRSEHRSKTSRPLGNYVKTDQPTDIPGHREVSLPKMNELVAIKVSYSLLLPLEILDQVRALFNFLGAKSDKKARSAPIAHCAGVGQRMRDTKSVRLPLSINVDLCGDCIPTRR